MQFGCTYAAVNVARVCTVALDHGIRVGREEEGRGVFGGGVRAKGVNAR